MTSSTFDERLNKFRKAPKDTKGERDPNFKVFGDMLDNPPPPWRRYISDPLPPKGAYGSSDYQGVERDDDECSFSNCMKGFVVLTLMALIVGASGYFAWQFIRPKFFPDHDPYFFDPKNYDPNDPRLFQDFNPEMYKGGEPPRSGIMSKNPTPGMVSDVKREQVLDDILQARTGLVVVENFNRKSQACQAIEPALHELAQLFPQTTFIKFHAVPGYSLPIGSFEFYCSFGGLPSHIRPVGYRNLDVMESPNIKDLREKVVEHVRGCGQMVQREYQRAYEDYTRYYGAMMMKQGGQR